MNTHTQRLHRSTGRHDQHHPPSKDISLSADLRKTTLIRGVALKPGSIVYVIRTFGSPEDIIEFPLHADSTSLIPRLETRIIRVTNGKSFAFAHAPSHSPHAVKKTWLWVDRPDLFLVTPHEVRSACERLKKSFVAIGQGMLARAQYDAEQAQTRLKEITTHYNALTRGTHLAFKSLNDNVGAADFKVKKQERR